MAAKQPKPKAVLPPAIQDLVARLTAPRFVKQRPAAPKPAGLWPRDARGQYISDRRDSHGNVVTKRFRHAKVVLS